jgi:hypothetical protein
MDPKLTEANRRNETIAQPDLHDQALQALDNARFREFLAEYDDAEGLSNLENIDDSGFAETVVTRFEAFKAYQEVEAIIAKNLQAQVKKEAGFVFSPEQLAQITKGARQKAIEDPVGMRAHLETARSFAKLKKDMESLEIEGRTLIEGGVTEDQIIKKLAEARKKKDVLGLAAETGFVEVLKAKRDDPKEALEGAQKALLEIDPSVNQDPRELFLGQVRFARVWVRQVCDRLASDVGKKVISNAFISDVIETFNKELEPTLERGQGSLISNGAGIDLNGSLILSLKSNLDRTLGVKQAEFATKSESVKMKALLPFLELYYQFEDGNFWQNLLDGGFEEALSRRQSELKKNIEVQTERKKRLDARKEAETMGYQAPTVGEKPGSKFRFLRRLSEWEGDKKSVFAGLDSINAEIATLEGQKANLEAIAQRAENLLEKSKQAKSLLSDSFVDTQVLAALTREITSKMIQDKVNAVDQALKDGRLDLAQTQATQLSGYLNRLKTVTGEEERGVSDLDVTYIDNDSSIAVTDLRDPNREVLKAEASDFGVVISQRLQYIAKGKIEKLVAGITDKSGSAVTFARGIERFLTADASQFESREGAISFVKEVLAHKAEDFKKGSTAERAKAIVLRAVLAKIKSS